MKIKKSQDIRWESKHGLTACWLILVSAMLSDHTDTTGQPVPIVQFQKAQPPKTELSI